ncbi:MAG: hypothetical protein MUF38_03735, partial [Anaerolineae bacterium]|nr:hypothetical protein [Anaerolineae bacterium]
IIALRLGYRTGTAWLGALIFGVATLALPYSRWLFREPLMALFALWAFAAAVEVRRTLTEQRPPYTALAFLVFSTLAMILTKQAGILFVPGLFLCLMPPLRAVRRYLPILAILAGVIGLFLVVVALLNPDFGDGRYNLMRWLDPANLGLNFIVESLLGYQFSPARSIWLYSPVLVLGFIGMVSLLRRDGTRWLVIGVVASLIITSAAYGALRQGAYWSGGWNWGPRYTLPLIPLLMLLVLPVIESARNRRRWASIALGVLVTVSVGMQLLGMVVPYTDFYNRYYLDAPAETGWLAQNWAWEPNIISDHLSRFSLADFDSAWRVSPGAAAAGLYFVALIVAALALVWAAKRLPHRRTGAWVGLPLALVIGVVIGLLSLRDDPRYIGSRGDVAALVNQLNTATRSDDIVVLGGSEFMVMFMNSFKAPSLLITLPDEPTMPAPDAPSRRALGWAASRTDRLWMVAPAEYALGEPRHLETFLTHVYYPQAELTLSPYARAVLFDTARTLPLTNRTPETPLSFEGGLALENITLPTSLTITAGDTLPIGLVWQATQPLTDDYQISVQLVAEADGRLVAQRDSPPQNGLTRTSLWEIGQTYLDPHSLALPADLPPGTYQIEVIAYRLDTLERLRRADDPTRDSLMVATVEVAP